MTGTTAGGLPFPEGTDLVRDGDNAIRALAEAFNVKRSDFPWTGSFGHYGQGRLNASVFTYPGRTEFGGALTRTAPLNGMTPGTAYPIGQLPVGLRPLGGTREMQVACGFTPGERTARLLVTTTGVIQLMVYAAGSWIVGGNGYIILDNAGFARNVPDAAVTATLDAAPLTDDDEGAMAATDVEPDPEPAGAGPMPGW